MTHETLPALPPGFSTSAPATVPASSAAAAAVPAPSPAPAFLTMRQLADALGVSRRTLTTWNQRHIIPSVRVGRVRRYELEQVRHALRTHGQPASGIHIPAGPAAAS